jgi:inosine-uridine nucleoside N-ribohydrolase
MQAGEVRQHFTGPFLRPVLDMAEVWFGGFYPFITFHDPLAAATIFDDRICTYQQGTVGIEAGDQEMRITWEPGGHGAPHQAAMTVDVERYFEDFFRVVG